MNEMGWIKDLVRAEQKMEESGVIDVAAGFDPDRELHLATTSYLVQLKDLFIESANVFNQLRGIAIGGVKIYGIAQTESDFMLFRHGFKLIFSMKRSGLISVRFQHQGAGFVAGAAASPQNIEEAPSNEDLVEAKWGAFGEILWTYKRLPINSDQLVRYYMSRFIKESAK